MKAEGSLATGDDASSGRSLQRGLQVLEAVVRGGRDGVRVVDLCRACDLERATVHRIVAVLAATGHVRRRDRFRYVAGPLLGRLTGQPAETDLAARLKPVLARVSVDCGDAAFAVIRDGGLSRCIARHIGTHPIQVLVVQVGWRQPLGVGAAGLALLAALDAVDAAAVIDGNRDGLARYGGMTGDRLRLLVASTRERGWSVVANHAVRGTLGVGMPLLDGHGRPLAAISVAAPVERMPRPRQKEIACSMREALGTLAIGAIGVIGDR